LWGKTRQVFLPEDSRRPAARSLREDRATAVAVCSWRVRFVRFRGGADVATGKVSASGGSPSTFRCAPPSLDSRLHRSIAFSSFGRRVFCALVRRQPFGRTGRARASTMNKNASARSRSVLRWWEAGTCLKQPACGDGSPATATRSHARWEWRACGVRSASPHPTVLGRRRWRRTCSGRSLGRRSSYNDTQQSGLLVDPASITMFPGCTRSDTCALHPTGATMRARFRSRSRR
jgi:hypothetical protein